MPCFFCDHPAWMLWYMNKGCVAHRFAGTQALCVHHTLRATPIDEMIDITPWFCGEPLW